MKDISICFWNKLRYLRKSDCTGKRNRHLSECVCPDRKPVMPLPGTRGPTVTEARTRSGQGSQGSPFFIDIMI